MSQGVVNRRRPSPLRGLIAAVRAAGYRSTVVAGVVIGTAIGAPMSGWFDRAFTALDDGNYRAAVREVAAVFTDPLLSPYDRAVAEHGRGHYEAAYARFAALAAQGVAEAQYSVGYMHWHGHGFAADTAEAMQWWQRAAEQGHADAQARLGWAHLNTPPVAIEEALRWFREAAQQGHPDGQFGLATMYSLGVAVDEDSAEAVRWARLSADRGNPGAQYLLGAHYENGWGVDVDLVQARSWFVLAARSGHENVVGEAARIAEHMTAAEVAASDAWVAEWRPVVGR